MVTVIKKGTPINEQLEKLNKVVAKKSKGISTKKYSGALTNKVDPEGYQSEVRNEWK